MKHFNTVFDIFLYEGIFIFFFSALLFLLNDRFSDILFTISIISVIIAAILGIVGHFFHLFQQEDQFEEK